jgi:hypothetical protein
LPLSDHHMHNSPAMSRRAAVSLAFLALVGLVAPGGAQSTRALSDLTAGARVRYTVNNRERDRYVGIFATTVRDSLFLRAELDTTALPLALDHLALLEVSTGKDTHFRRDALYGAVGGAAAGVIVVAARLASNKRHDCPATVLGDCFAPEPARNYPRGAVEGGLTGVLLGLGVACIDRTDHWLKVSLPTRGIGSLEGFLGPSVGMRMTF